MEAPEVSGDEDAFTRRKKTVNLLIAGMVVLLLPLLGIAFLMRKKADDGSGGGITSMYLFQKRKGVEAIVPITTTAPNKASLQQNSLIMPSESGSAGSPSQMSGGLGFIRGGEDYAEEPAPPPAEPEKKEEEKKEEPPAEDAKAQLGTAPADLPPPPKMVDRPKLKFTGRSEAGSFAKPRMADNIQSKTIESQAGASGPGGAAGGSMGASGGGGMPLGGGGGMPSGGMPPGMPPGGMPDMSQMMKNMPGGGAGMPDMSQMMKNLPGGGAGGGMPDMSQLMKGMTGGAAPPATDTKTKTKKKTTGL